LGLEPDLIKELTAHFAGPSLTCPGCARTMSVVRLKGVGVNICQGCGGLWLERGELLRLTEGLWPEDHTAPAPPPPLPEPPAAPRWPFLRRVVPQGLAIAVVVAALGTATYGVMRLGHVVPWSENLCRPGRVLGFQDPGENFRRTCSIWCGDNGALKASHPDGTVCAEGRQVRGDREGLWSLYHPNGRLAQQGPYRGGKRHGTWRWWFASGQLQGTCGYKDDRLHGDYEGYHPNGQLWRAGEFREGKQEGAWRFLAEDGSLKEAKTFSGGVEVR
jgi:hypothetical protein